MRSNAVYRIQIGPPDRPRLGSIWLDSPHDDLDDPILPQATFKRCLATLQRCLATFQRCLATFQPCLLPFKRC